MFAAKTKAVIKDLGVWDLINNDSVNRELDMLTLVKVDTRRRKFFPKVSPPVILDCSLTDLLDTDLPLEYEEKVLVEDFQRLSHYGGNVGIKGGVDVAGGHLQAEADSVDTTSAVTLMSRKAPTRSLRRQLSGKKINDDKVNMLRLGEAQKLAFVKQRVYNSAPVTFWSKVSAAASISGKFVQAVAAYVTGQKTELRSFVVPSDTTFAYGLQDIDIQDGVLQFPLDILPPCCSMSKSAVEVVVSYETVVVEEETFCSDPRASYELLPEVDPVIRGQNTPPADDFLYSKPDVGDETFPSDSQISETQSGYGPPEGSEVVCSKPDVEAGDENSLYNSPGSCGSGFAWSQLDVEVEDEQFDSQAIYELKYKESLLQPLADVPDPTRRDLLKTLGELLEDEDALALLEETLDPWSQGASDRPPSQLVSAFVDLLDGSEDSAALREAAHLLVSAMDTLPDGVAALLVGSSPDSLTALRQTVDTLKEEGQAQLPELLPLPLQEEGELRWVVEFLCLTNHAEAELSDSWEWPDFSAEVLLEVLCVIVLGLDMMQPRTGRSSEEATPL